MSQIGWGETSVYGYPSGAPYTLSSGVISGSYEMLNAGLGVIGPYTTVLFSFDWTPVTLGEVSGLAFTDLGGGDYRVETSNPGWPAYTAGPFGEFTIYATVDGIPAENTLTVVVGFEYSWYNTYAFGFDSAGPPPKFWANLVGTTEP